MDLRHSSNCAEHRPLHVVMLLPTYVPESFGGMEQQCRKLSRALSQHGVQVTILAPRLLSATPRFEQDGDVTIRRFRVRNVPNLGGRYIVSLGLWAAGVVAWLWAYRSQVDVVHIFHGRLHALPGVLGGALFGKPSVVKIGRGGEHFDLSLVRAKRLLGPFAYRMLLEHATGYIANSGEIVDDLLEHRIRQDQIFAVPNGVEIPTANHDDRRQPNRRYPRQYLYLGRLDPEKRMDLMLTGFARLADHSARLIIVGDGTCRSDLERLVAQLGISARVTFTGRANDVFGYLRAADFYLSTSSSEGMSNALLEAMSFGVVPLVSKVSGAKDLVEHGRTGFLFEPNNLQDFVSKLELINTITDEEHKTMSNAAKDVVRRGFGIERIALRHLEIYRTLLEWGDPRTHGSAIQSGNLNSAAEPGDLRICQVRTGSVPSVIGVARDPDVRSDELAPGQSA